MKEGTSAHLPEHQVSQFMAATHQLQSEVHYATTTSGECHPSKEGKLEEFKRKPHGVPSAPPLHSERATMAPKCLGKGHCPAECKLQTCCIRCLELRHWAHDSKQLHSPSDDKTHTLTIERPDHQCSPTTTSLV